MSINKGSEQIPGDSPANVVNDTYAKDNSRELLETSPAAITEDPTLQLLEAEWAIYQDPTMSRHVWGQE